MDVDGAGLGGLLRACRKVSGLSQQQLADRSGLSIRAVSNIERGRSQWPYRDSLSRLADALGLQETARAEFLAAAPRRRLALQPASVSINGGPRQLPAAVGCFTGREDELAALNELLTARPADTASAAMLISAIGGTAGVGKTALAIEWAHQVAAQFPDGQLYVDLRGYDLGQPVAAEEALAGFLSALWVPGPQIPADAASRAAAYRSLLAGRRVLILLDNARSAEQVRPLLPGEPGCIVVVTSRDMLAGMVARDGARRILLDVLPSADAVALLRSLVGARVDAEPEAAARLAGLCCRLPLALRVAAELAIARPAMSLAALAGELDRPQRLDALEAGGDPATAVRAVFSWSYRHLSPGAARAFRLAALHPGMDFETSAFAALTGTGQHAATRALAELARASLLHPVGNTRHGMHDLLRGYAAELAATEDTETGRGEALIRLLDFYLSAAHRAAKVLFPADVPTPADEPGDASALVVTDEQDARTWLDAERPNLAAVAVFASDHGWTGHAVGLSADLFRYLETGGFLTDALAIHGAAARAAARAGDRAAEANAVSNTGFAYLSLGRRRLAKQHFQRALGLSRGAGDHLGEIRALGNLSQAYLHLGAYPDAADTCRQALELSRAVGDRVREARSLGILGLVALRQGRYQQAAAGLQQAVKASRAEGDLTFLTVSLTGLSELEVRRGRHKQVRRYLQEARTTAHQIGIAETEAVLILGLTDLREGRHQQAGQQLQEALTEFRDVGIAGGEAQALCCLGELDLRLDRPGQAADRYRQALAIYQRITEPAGVAEARNGLGETALARGALKDARAHYQAALAVARKIASPEHQARAHEGLGNLSAVDCDGAEARAHWQQALALYTSMEVPDSSRIRAKLTGD